MFTVSTINVCGRTLTPGDGWLMEIQNGRARDIQPEPEHRFEFYLDFNGVPWIDSWGGTDLPEGVKLEGKDGRWVRVTPEMRVQVESEWCQGTLACHVRDGEQLIPTWYNADQEVPAQLPGPKMKELQALPRRLPRDKSELFNGGPLYFFGKRVVAHGEEFLRVDSTGIQLGQRVEDTCVVAIGMDSRGWPYARLVRGEVHLNGAPLAMSRTYLDIRGADRIRFPQQADLELRLDPQANPKCFQVTWRRDT